MQITEETIEGKIYIRHVQQLMFMLLLYTEYTSKDNLLMQITETTIEGKIPYTAKHPCGKTFVVTRKNRFRWKSFAVYLFVI